MRVLSALAILLASLAPLAAQNTPLNTTPEISLSFPFDQNEQGVITKYTLLINDTTILPAKSILRVIYTPPRVDDDRLRAIRTASNADAAYTRDNRLKDTDKISPSELARRKIVRETVWPSITNFQLALANQGADDLHIVYVLAGATPENFKFYDQRFLLPEGLFLAEANGEVIVLAVEKDKPGERAGIKASDTIIKVGDHAVNGSLTTYLDAYMATKKDAKLTMKTSFPMTLKAVDGTERVVAIKLPPSIGTGGFLDTPIDTTTSSSGTKSTSTSTNTPPSLVPEVWEKKKATAPPAPNP